MQTVKYFSPNQIITLYNCHEDKYFDGVLYINPLTTAGLSSRSNMGFIKKMAFLYLLAALVGIFSLALPVASAKVSSQFNKPNPKQVVLAQSSFPKPPIIEPNNFDITIPKINLSSVVIPDVDTTSEVDYKQKLMEGVAHANDSYFPGEAGLVFLFAHSTDSIANILKYNAKFIDIDKLDVGDQIQINYKGKLYKYGITGKKIINPEDLNSIRNSGADLVLSTCWPLGTDWQRLLLFAKTV